MMARLTGLWVEAYALGIIALLSAEPGRYSPANGAPFPMTPDYTSRPDYASMHEAPRPILRDHLEVRLVLCEMRRPSLSFELDSPKTSPEDRPKLTAMRNAAPVEWAELMTQLEEIKKESDSR